MACKGSRGFKTPKLHCPRCIGGRPPLAPLLEVPWFMMMKTPGLTARIRFRPYVPHDAAAVSEMFADPKARRFYPEMAEPARAMGWIDWNLDNYATHGFGLWVIEHRDEGWFLGDCGLTYQSVEGEQWLEVGYHLQEQHRGNGYATEAAHACVTYAFERMAAPLVCSIVDPENAASKRVASQVHSSHRVFRNGNGRMMDLYWSVGP